MAPSQVEKHRTERVGWLRAAVLGANDGILSTSSLVLGVAAANGDRRSVLLAGIAGLVAGSMSMAAGEYVSVHSQADTEQADLQLEREELKTDDKGEHRELAAIYVARGLDPSLAKQVADQLMARDALGAHARDELGISTALAASKTNSDLGTEKLGPSSTRYTNNRTGTKDRADHMNRRQNGIIVNFTTPCDGSHFDDATTWYDDSDGLD